METLRVDTRSSIIIGAGPAGLAAAIAAARRGASVVVLEKGLQPGRKLLITGGGRANLMDPASSALDALEAYGRTGRFLRQVVASFDWTDFLSHLNVRTETEKGGLREGSIYARGGAKRLLDALLDKAAKLGVEIVADAAAREAVSLPDGGFEVRTNRGNWAGARLIIATGGVTYPATGSSGDGYRLAEGFGHGIEPPRPALCALVTDPHFPQLAGVSVADATMTLRREGRKLAARRGGLLFTHHGISGPPALDLSLELARACESPEGIVGSQIVADLLPETTREQTVQEFLAYAKAHPKRFLANARLGNAPSSPLMTALARRISLNPDQPVAQFARRDFAALAGEIKSLTLTIRQPLDPNAAMITVGGVRTKEIDPRTMESRIVPGLFIAGELLAPAGPCGGYNLRMAFATGQAAGQGAAPH
jgi:hypothetical protein